MHRAADELYRVADRVFPRLPFLPLGRQVNIECSFRCHHVVCLIGFATEAFSRRARSGTWGWITSQRTRFCSRDFAAFKMNGLTCSVLAASHSKVDPLRPQAPNIVRVDGERLPVQELANFRARVEQRYRYSLADLWASGGLDWEQALAVAIEALKKVPLA